MILLILNLKQELFDNYNLDPENYNNTSELINSFIKIDGGKFFITSLNKTIMDLIVSNLLDNFIKQAKKPKSEEISQEEEDSKNVKNIIYLKNIHHWKLWKMIIINKYFLMLYMIILFIV